MTVKAGFVLNVVLALFAGVSVAYAQNSPVFSSTPVTSGVFDQPYAYLISTSDVENDLREIVLTSGVLPGGVSLVDNGDGTATLGGNVIEVGSFPIELTVRELGDPMQLNVQSFTIEMEKATPIVNWNDPADIVYGTSLNAVQLNAMADVAGSFVYTPSFGAILNAGEDQILSVDFFPVDPTNYHSVLGVEVLLTVQKSTPVVSWIPPADIAYGTPLGTDQLNATSDVAGTFVYVPPAGTVLPVGDDQDLFVSFYPTNTINYNEVANVQRSIDVKPGIPVITWNAPAPIVYGTLLSATQLSATADVPGTFTYDPPLGTLLNAGVNRVLSVDFLPDDQVQYAPINNVTVLITVERATPIVTWGAPSPIRVNEPLGAVQLNASANVPGSFSYTPASGTSFPTLGTYTLSVDFLPTDAGNYNTVAGTTVEIDVAEKDLPVVTWPSPSAISYGTPLSNTQLNATADVAGTFSYDPPVGTLLNAGANQTLEVTFTPADMVNYSLVTSQITISVTKVPLTATASDQSRVYGAVNPTFLFSYAGFVNGENAGVLTTEPVFGTTANVTSPIGSYPISGAGGVDENYEFNYVAGTLTITKATLTATGTSHTRAYGAPNPVLAIAYSGFANGENESLLATPPTVSTAATTLSGVGQYPVVVSGGVASNYDLVYVNGTLEIVKATLTVTAEDKARTYGAMNPVLTAQYLGFVNGENGTVLNSSPVLSTTAVPASGVGTFPIQVSGGMDDNYQFSYVPGTLTVDKATLTISATNQSRPYGSVNPPLSIQYAGFVNGENSSVLSQLPVASTLASVTSNAGSYTIELSPAIASNYDFVYLPGVLVVSKINLTITAGNQSKPYGAAMPPLTFSYSGFVMAEDESVLTTPVVISTPATAASNAGSYPIQLGGGSADNYQLLYVPGVLTITKVDLSVTTGSYTRVYGEANPPLTVAFNGFVSGETALVLDAMPVASTAAVADTDAGIYPIVITGGTDNNYNFNFASGTLTITKAILTITAVSYSRPYGSPNATEPISYSGFVVGEAVNVLNVAPTLAATATVSSLPGAYSVLVFGAQDNNYDFIYVPGIITITKAVLTVRATNLEKFYGSPNLPLSMAYEGFVNGENSSSLTIAPLLTTAVTSASVAGSYPILVSGAVSDKYEFNYINGVFLVKKVDLTVSTSNLTRPYGSVNPVFTLTFSGFVNGETVTSLSSLPVATTTATTDSPAGQYPITVAGGVSVNYNFVSQPATLTVTKIPLVVKGEDAVKTYGSSNPVFTVSFTGFINGETSAVLDVPPSASSTATASSNVGLYPVQTAGGSDNNYGFVYQPGVLTIEKALLIAKADNKFRLIGESNPPLTISYTGFVNQQNEAVLDVPPNVTTTATADSPTGVYPIELQGGSDNNYRFELQPGLLTVNAIPVLTNSTVTAIEDVDYVFDYADFGANFSDDAWDAIKIIRIVQLPSHGLLTVNGNAVQAGREIPLQGGIFPTLIYRAQRDYHGDDSFGWNASDGISFAGLPATLSVKIEPVNDPPTLHNVEITPLEYSPGAAPVPLTAKLVINDVDNTSVFGASVSISENYGMGDVLDLPELDNRDIEVTFHKERGELVLTGKDTRSNYERMLAAVVFSSPVEANVEVTDKRISFVVSDSLAASVPASRVVRISEIFPDIEIVNSFTPNDDGVNDYWDFLNMQYYAEVRISIFDQSGVPVFECSQPDCRWDGRKNGNLLPAGPYFYIIDLNQGRRKYQGMVTILR